MKLTLGHAQNLFSKIPDTLKVLFVDKRESDFIRHNRSIWKNLLSENSDGEILLEMFPVATSIISFSYLANILSKRHHAIIKSHIPYEKNVKKLILDRKIKKIFQSFNVKDFIYYRLRPYVSERDELFQEIYNKLTTKTDVEKLEVEGIWIGDLLYDSHLRNHRLPTLDINDIRFRNSLKDALSRYLYWRHYFNSHKIKAIIVSHCVYVETAIILRIAIDRGIPAYQINATHLHYLSKENVRAYNEFFYFPELFQEFTHQEQRKALDLAAKRLQKRFSGEVGVDMQYSSKSAYTGKNDSRILKKSSKIKILVATHCFFDSPHPYGVNLFPDFYEWLTFLGEVSRKTDYDWYIKTHPDFLPGNIEIIERLIRKYPKFTMIPSETSHLQIVDEGIDFALTVYGTIGVEYAALGIPVVNASLCNPRIRYGFNMHPKTIEEYESILLNLPHHKLSINLEEVYEYYYMAHIHRTKNWLFNDYEGFINEIGGYAKQFGPISYQKFLEEFSAEKHRRIIHLLNKFIESKDYCFQEKHMMIE